MSEFVPLVSPSRDKLPMALLCVAIQPRREFPAFDTGDGLRRSGALDRLRQPGSFDVIYDRAVFGQLLGCRPGCAH
jgi:hypothetical protein